MVVSRKSVGDEVLLSDLPVDEKLRLMSELIGLSGLAEDCSEKSNQEDFKFGFLYNLPAQYTDSQGGEDE